MSWIKKIGLVGFFCLILLPAHSAMVSTPELGKSPNQAQLINALQNQQLQEQLIALGVDPEDARSRVSQMTESEIANLQSTINDQPAGAGGISNTTLLIIIILILLI